MNIRTDGTMILTDANNGTKLFLFAGDIKTISHNEGYTQVRAKFPHYVAESVDEVIAMRDATIEADVTNQPQMTTKG